MPKSVSRHTSTIGYIWHKLIPSYRFRCYLFLNIPRNLSHSTWNTQINKHDVNMEKQYLRYRGRFQKKHPANSKNDPNVLYKNLNRNKAISSTVPVQRPRKGNAGDSATKTCRTEGSLWRTGNLSLAGLLTELTEGLPSLIFNWSWIVVSRSQLCRWSTSRHKAISSIPVRSYKTETELKLCFDCVRRNEPEWQKRLITFEHRIMKDSWKYHGIEIKFSQPRKKIFNFIQTVRRVQLYSIER